jgi:hypothetical protein
MIFTVRSDSMIFTVRSDSMIFTVRSDSMIFDSIMSRLMRAIIKHNTLSQPVCQSWLFECFYTYKLIYNV